MNSNKPTTPVVKSDTVARDLPRPRTRFKISDIWGGSLNLKTVMNWTTKGGLAIVDQGLIAGSNFLLSILLARWLDREEYGAFALGFAVFILVATLYQALLLEPMAVFGGSDYYPRLRTYLHALVRIHLVATVGIVFALGLSAGVAQATGHANGLPGALAGAAIAAPCVLLLWLARRTFYLQYSSSFAVRGSLIYCVLLVGGLFLAHSRGLISSFAAFALTGLSALLSAAVLFLGLHSRLKASDLVLHVREVWIRHWNYGRWSLLAAAAMWIPANTFYPVVSSFAGVASAGELKALLNFFNPIFQAYAALSLLLLPYASRTQSEGGNAGTLAWRITLLGASGTIVYWVAIILLRRPAFHLLYGGRYMEVAPLLPVVALGSVFENAFFGPAIILRAMEAPKAVFVALLAAAIFCIAVGVPATWAFGVRGAVWSQSLSSVVGFFAAVLVLKRKLASIHVDVIKQGSSLVTAQ
jgi:O-antigen/teichoic acid export membrane protein